MGIKEKIRNNPKLMALLQIDDTEHSIAMGAAVGMWIGLTPTVGIQMWMAFMMSFVMKFNRIWAIAMVWISNPITMGPMYYAEYRVGQLLLGMKNQLTYARLVTHSGAPFNLDELGQFNFIEAFGVSLQRLFGMGMGVVGPMFFGGLLLGLALAWPTYVGTLKLVLGHRQRKDTKRAQKQKDQDPETEERQDRR